jgi:hypothetical protein
MTETGGFLNSLINIVGNKGMLGGSTAAGVPSPKTPTHAAPSSSPTIGAAGGLGNVAGTPASGPATSPPATIPGLGGGVGIDANVLQQALAHQQYGVQPPYGGPLPVVR